MESITRTLRFVRCRMPGLGLARLRLDGVLSLKESVITGQVNLDHAQIDGELHLSGATLGDDPAVEALLGESLLVTGRADFGDGFTATGSVRLPHARFGSAVRFSRARITTSGQWGALHLDNAHIGGSLTLRAATVTSPGRVAIAGGGLRADAELQALTAGALEPEWEARFESRSYGFRPGRSCQDAMQAVFVTARGKTCKRRGC